MSENYCIIEIELDEGVEVLACVPAGSNKCFLHDWERRKNFVRLNKLTATIEKIIQYGSTNTSKLRYLNVKGLYEIKHFDGAHRVLAYIHDDFTIVLLSAFQGHQGKTSNVKIEIDKVLPKLSFIKEYFENRGI